MGRTITPKYRVETTPVSGYHTPAAWTVTQFGRVVNGKPTNENLAKYVASYHKSLLPGECNDHLGKGSELLEAKIVRQSDDVVVATWKECACGGTGAMPSVHPDKADENGYERCPDCNAATN